jgi:AcrR family transcriptional regulator
MSNELPSVNTHVYGRMMNERLTRSDWLRHGLRTLASDGVNALKVGPMATKLKVSRGSFYWHFRDIADFQSQLLQSWREISTDQVIRDLDAREGDPDRVKDLMRRAFRGTRRLDRAVRSWAAQDADVAAIVASVDATRVARISRLLVEVGVEDEQAQHRAGFLYWAYLGQAAVMDPRHSSIPAAALDAISELFESLQPAEHRAGAGPRVDRG